MLVLSLFRALQAGMVVGLVAPFSTLPGIYNRNIEPRTDTPCRTHSTTTTTTALFSDPTDEDLFIALFREKEGRKAAVIPRAERNSDDAKSAPPSSYDIVMGAGVPRSSLEPEDIVSLLMTALQNVDVPIADGGLVSMWEFASDTTKFIFQNNRTEFIESCHETADEFPTSFYGAAMNGRSWAIETQLNRVGGDNGWIATQVTSTISSDGRMRRWQWELRKNRRPPCLGCWRVENIASSDRKGNFEPD